MPSTMRTWSLKRHVPFSRGSQTIEKTKHMQNHYREMKSIVRIQSEVSLMRQPPRHATFLSLPPPHQTGFVLLRSSLLPTAEFLPVTQSLDRHLYLLTTHMRLVPESECGWFHLWNSYCHCGSDSRGHITRRGAMFSSLGFPTIQFTWYRSTAVNVLPPSSKLLASTLQSQK